jgi:type I restriction enzyme S subunit
MNGYNKARIGDICRIVKGETGIASAEPGQYPLVTTGAERKTSKTFQFDTEAVCIPLVSSTGHGKKTLNYVHYQKGQFALGTILAAVIPRDPKKVSAGFLHRYLQFYKDRKIVPLMKGAANVSLAIKDIAKIEIPVPPIEEQTNFISLFNKANGFGVALLSEFTNQSNFLSRLRQTILQEAIEGKLTADWRSKNPVRKGDPDTDAAALLEKIKTEKQKLIAEGKIKKEKPLATPIKPEEMPFDLPEGWIWCRLEDYGYLLGGGTPATNEPKYWGGGIPWVCPKDMKNEVIRETIDTISDLGLSKSSAKLIPGGSILFVVRGMILAHTFPVGINDKPVAINQDMKALVSYIPKTKKYIAKMLNGYSQRILALTNTSTHGTKRLEYSKSYSKLIFPLPPLAEQSAIVERVDRLLAMVDELEKQVTERKGQAEALMQAVLHEAFEGK